MIILLQIFSVHFDHYIGRVEIYHETAFIFLTILFTIITAIACLQYVLFVYLLLPLGQQINITSTLFGRLAQYTVFK